MKGQVFVDKLSKYTKPVANSMMDTFGLLKTKTETNIISPVLSFVKSKFS